MAQQGIVLVVDDEPVGLEVVSALLGKSGYDLHFASNGPQALEKAEALRPDLILLDVIMPGMSGFDVCRVIRENPAIADVPVILLTALNDRDAKIQGIRAGADDFIAKPFDRLELSVRVRTILRLNRYRRLMAERAKFGWVVETADDGYLLVDSAGRIEYANPRARRLLSMQIDAELPTDESLLTIAKRQYQCQPAAAWRDWPTPSTNARHLVRPQTDSAETLWLQVDVMSDNVVADDGFLVRLRDVTNDVVQQRMTWSFNAQIQHKFRHPLTTLTGHLDLLRDGDLLSADERSHVSERAYHSATRLQDEILSVLNYLSVAEERNGKPESSNLQQAIDIANDLPRNFENATVTVDVCEHIGPQTRLPLSRSNLEMIFWELVGNAQKFHPTRSPLVDIRFDCTESNICISITDDGLTLAPEQLQQIWMPYYQAEAYFTGQIPGMGLGLSMVSSLIWGSGGTCEAFNRTDGNGLVIQLGLPKLV